MEPGSPYGGSLFFTGFDLAIQAIFTLILAASEDSCIS